MIKKHAIIYDDFSGFPLKVSYFNGQWWVTSPGERLRLADELYEEEQDLQFIYLCDADEQVGAMALAKMLGKATENPETYLWQTLSQRVDTLRRLGVRLNPGDETLSLEVRVIKNKAGSKRHGNFLLWVRNKNYCEWFVNADAFETEEDAQAVAYGFCKFLENLGIIINIKKNDDERNF